MFYKLLATNHFVGLHRRHELILPYHRWIFQTKEQYKFIAASPYKFSRNTGSRYPVKERYFFMFRG